MTDVYACPVSGCERVFDNVDSLVSHVAGTAQNDDAHAAQRDSKNHRRPWYRDQCVDEDQLTLGRASK
jgi:hypothetical protein